MAPNPGNGEHAAGGGSRGWALFQEEGDRLILAGAAFRAAFSRKANGALVSLVHLPYDRELIYADEAAEGDLWRIALLSSTGATVALTSSSCDSCDCSADTDSAGTVHLSLTWQGLRAGAAHLPGRIVARFSVPREGRLLFAEVSADLPEGLSVARVEFPRVCSVGVLDPGVEEALFLPLSDGLLIPDPRGLLARAGHREWEAEYPGPASVQLFGYTCTAQTTLWLSCRDASGAHKSLVTASLPQTNRLALWLAHSPPAQAGGQWDLGYPCVLGLADGDWYEAAKEYRLWAIHQPWCGRGMSREHPQPALTTYQGIWLTHWGGGRSANESARELIRHVNAPVRLDWRGWHGEPYPDCFPPREGEEGFTQTVQELAEATIYAQLALPGGFASPASAAWQREDLGAATLGERSGATVALCPSAPRWQATLGELARQGAKRGAEGIFLEGLAAARPVVCTHEGHAHLPGDRAAWVQGVRGVLGAVRGALGESYQLAADGPGEAYLDLVDAFLTSHSAAERLSVFGDRFGGRWSPIPLFTSIYHEYHAHLGLGPTLTCQAPMTGAAETHRRVDPAPGKDLATQFCLELARAMLWGRQLALSAFFPEQGREERNRRKLAFVAAALRAQSWGVGAVLSASEFLGPLVVEAPAMEADFLTGLGKAERSGEGVRVTRRRLTPVLGTAWRIPGGGNALLMANLHEHQVEFSAKLNAGRMVLNLPLQVVGRTFSEDGDAPAATLRTSGTDLGGRLPARSLMLVTLY